MLQECNKAPWRNTTVQSIHDHMLKRPQSRRSGLTCVMYNGVTGHAAVQLQSHAHARTVRRRCDAHVLGDDGRLQLVLREAVATLGSAERRALAPRRAVHSPDGATLAVAQLERVDVAAVVETAAHVDASHGRRLLELNLRMRT